MTQTLVEKCTYFNAKKQADNFILYFCLKYCIFHPPPQKKTKTSVDNFFISGHCIKVYSIKSDITFINIFYRADNLDH